MKFKDELILFMEKDEIRTELKYLVGNLLLYIDFVVKDKNLHISII